MTALRIVAILTAKRDALHGIADLPGFEEWTYIVLTVWIAVAGPGPISLDRLLQRVTLLPFAITDLQRPASSGHGS